MTKKHFVPWCPKCESKDISEYVNGMPDFIYYEKLEKQGFKFIYNGCVLDGEEQDFHCNSCGNDYTWHDWHAKRKDMTVIDDSAQEEALAPSDPDAIATEADVDALFEALQNAGKK